MTKVKARECEGHRRQEVNRHMPNHRRAGTCHSPAVPIAACR